LAGIFVIGFGFALTPLALPVLSRLTDANGFLSGNLILLSGFVEASAAFAILFIGLWLWRRSVTRGLAKVDKRGERLQSYTLFEDFVRDMPVPVRWVVLAIVVLLSFYSLAGLWRTRDELSLARIERMSFFGGWLSIGMPLLGLYVFGRLLVRAARMWRRTRD
jgi:hypothetical protein